MPRSRVHNLNISLDGYAAGDHVTFDTPIGGAERLHRRVGYLAERPGSSVLEQEPSDLS